MPAAIAKKAAEQPTAIPALEPSARWSDSWGAVGPGVGEMEALLGEADAEQQSASLYFLRSDHREKDGLLFEK